MQKAAVYLIITETDRTWGRSGCMCILIIQMPWAPCL